ncbi:hypothetical protein GTW25_06120 [Aliihoeflea aestuarii]|jgi:hypothetical protein|uniref:hypothetical protein n=1 Tax=Aliihoeflea aestuarii TaxID=453840 RepID=UPI002093205E|nr:hypothetical protein [Aliihoeflea aestuarii]MCO6390601.1 hypothetical protein [Aliihoeflea aestuarii]
MSWKFDQAPNVACITCQSVIDGHPVLIATHYEDDHSWGFMDGAPIDMAKALVVAMSEVVGRHPDLDEVADLPPGWSATRVAVGDSWSKQRDDWASEV